MLIQKVISKQKRNKPPHDKTSNVTVRPGKPQISLGIRAVWSESAWASQSDQSLLSTWTKLGSLATYWAHSEDWSDWADAQADLSLRWAHSHFVGFVMRRRKQILQRYSAVLANHILSWISLIFYCWFYPNLGCEGIKHGKLWHDCAVAQACLSLHCPPMW